MSTLEITVTFYVFSGLLKTKHDRTIDDYLDLREVNVYQLGLFDYHGGWNRKIQQGSTLHASAWCSVLTFDTDGDVVVVFVLQKQLGQGPPETRNQWIEKWVT
jgi:hypothetical protein